MTDMTKSITSLTFGCLLAGFLGFICFIVTQNHIVSNGWPENFGLIVGAFGFLGVFLYIGYFGMRNLNYLDNGVPLLIGQRQAWYIIPPGISWWLPWPFGEVVKVYIGQKTLDRTNKAKKSIACVLSKDHLEIEISLIVQYSVFHPYRFSILKNPEVALEGLIDRNVRWYVSLNNGEKIPQKRSELAEMISGEIIKVQDSEGNDVPTHRHVVDTAKNWGIKIDHVFVDDVNLPNPLTDAYRQVRIEHKQKSYESIETETVLSLMKKYRQEFPELTDKEILNAVQVERNKAKRVLIEGDAGDFTKGGYLSGQGGS